MSSCTECHGAAGNHHTSMNCPRFKRESAQSSKGDTNDISIKDYVEAAYLHGLCVENLDTGELEPPRDISEVQWIVADLEQKIAQETNKAVEAKNNAYWERNQLVGVLSRLYPSHLARHDENDKEWEDDWRNIVCVHTPVGQATWHLQDNDMPMFAHLERGADHWDGHTTEEKYHRLAQLTADKEQAL